MICVMHATNRREMCREIWDIDERRSACVRRRWGGRGGHVGGGEISHDISGTCATRDKGDGLSVVVARLCLEGGVERGVKQEHVVGLSQVNAHRPRPNR